MKQDKVQALKTLQSSDHFNTLSNDTKACVCSGFLFQKYLTDEIIQNNPLHFATDTKGDLIVIPEQLRQSELFNQAIHIKDFVFAYITNNPLNGFAIIGTSSMKQLNDSLTAADLVLTPEQIQWLTA